MPRLIQRALVIHRVAGPAATLMFITVGALLFARIAFASPAPPTQAQVEVWVPEQASPGATIEVTAEPTDAVARMAAYLPGLDLRRVSLRPSWPSGARAARLRVPSDAPRRGHFTVRLVFHDREGRRYTSDVAVALTAPPMS